MRQGSQPDVPRDKTDLRQGTGSMRRFRFKHPATGRETGKEVGNAPMKTSKYTFTDIKPMKILADGLAKILAEPKEPQSIIAPQ
jgi:hypothetical protein